MQTPICPGGCPGRSRRRRRTRSRCPGSSTGRSQGCRSQSRRRAHPGARDPLAGRTHRSLQESLIMQSRYFNLLTVLSCCFIAVTIYRSDPSPGPGPDPLNMATLYTLTVPLGSRPYCARWHSVPVGWKKPGVVAYVYQSPRYCKTHEFVHSAQ